MDKRFIFNAILGLTFCIFTCTDVTAQAYIGGSQTNGAQSNNIITAVPFLLITPDARTGSMGNAGVATVGDVNSSSINAAKLGFLPAKYGISLSYSPWLKNIVPDISLSYVSGYYKLSSRNTIAASLRYFSLGEVQLTDINQQPLGIANPNEIAADITFARTFGPGFSMGGSLRFISSNLTSGIAGSGQAAKAGNAVAIDIGGLFKKNAALFGKTALLSAGFNISNIGTKISYISSGPKYFLPANLKLGGATTISIDEYSDLTFALDFNKLLVPTQPIYGVSGNIVSGKDPERSVPSGIFGSFSDAPDGFSEEMKEISISSGAEYLFNKQFAVRIGYNHENRAKGDSQYLTLGAGLKYQQFNVDFSYLLSDPQRSPLANTLRFSLLFNVQ